MSREDDDLTFKQKMFVENFIANGGNATDAARQSGYKHPNKRGPENVVKSGIEERIQARIKDANVTASEVIGVLASHLRADIGDIYPDLPVVKAAKEAGVSHLIRRVIVKSYYDRLLKTKVEEVSLEIHSSAAAAKQLANVLGLQKEPQRNPLNAAREAYERIIEDEKWKGLGRESIARAVSKNFGVPVEQIMTDDETVM